MLFLDIAMKDLSTFYQQNYFIFEQMMTIQMYHKLNPTKNLTTGKNLSSVTEGLGFELLVINTEDR